MTGSVQEKKGYLCTVIRMTDGGYKWQSTGLKVKGNKKAAEKLLRERINELEQSEGMIDYRDILFTDFMLEWLDVAKYQIRPHIHHAYTLLVKNSINPHFSHFKLLLRKLQPHAPAKVLRLPHEPRWRVRQHSETGSCEYP